MSGIPSWARYARLRAGWASRDGRGSDEMIVIVDYGLGNVGSLLNMLGRLGAPAVVSGERKVLATASRLILPGVGSFDEGMRSLAARDLIGPLTDRIVGQGTPVLGVCLGAQLMTRGSEEGQRPGLGWLAADTVRFVFDDQHARLKIPHMGWAETQIERELPLFAHVPRPARFYYVHSYHFRCDREDDVVATAQHGYRFVSAFSSGHIVGVQFHPEKSHKFGMALLRSFAGDS